MTSRHLIVSLSDKSWRTSWWSPLFGLHGQSAHHCSHVVTVKTCLAKKPPQSYQSTIFYQLVVLSLASSTGLLSLTLPLSQGFYPTLTSPQKLSLLPPVWADSLDFSVAPLPTLLPPSLYPTLHQRARSSRSTPLPLCCAFTPLICQACTPSSLLFHVFFPSCIFMHSSYCKAMNSPIAPADRREVGVWKPPSLLLLLIRFTCPIFFFLMVIIPECFCFVLFSFWKAAYSNSDIKADFHSVLAKADTLLHKAHS